MEILTTIDLPLSSPLSLRERMLVLIKDFFAFVRKPTRGRPRNVGMKAGAGAILALLVMNALFNLLVYLPLMLALRGATGLNPRDSLGTGAFMFSAVALAPFIEELMFRAGLRSARWGWFGLPVVFASLWAGARITLGIAAAAVIVCWVDYLYQRRLPMQALVRSRWQRGRAFIRNYPLVLRMYAGMFAAAHLSNFVVDGSTGWKGAALVLAVTTQLMSGLVFSYLRLRYGLLSSIAAHFAWNACAIGIVLLAS